MKYLKLANFIKIAIYIVIGILIYQLLSRIISRTIDKSSKRLDKDNIKNSYLKYLKILNNSNRNFSNTFSIWSKCNFLYRRTRYHNSFNRISSSRLC